MLGVHLTPQGRTQASRVARHLAAEPIDHVVSSPMERARETAAPLAREKSLHVELSPAFTEVDAGNWTGRTFADLEQDESWRRFNQFRGGTAIPGGESAIQVQERVVGGLLRLRELHPNGTVAIVSHADPIKVALAYFLGAPIDFYDRLQIDFGSVSMLTLDGWNARVVRMNEVPGVGS